MTGLKHLFPPALAVALYCAAGVMTVPVAQAGHVQVNKGREIPDREAARYAISIRGGASKGAYEAGLNWGLLKLARDISDSADVPGGRAFGFRLESVTGASAGGINTILSGLTWCSRPESEGGLKSRIDDNIFRDIWLRADINTLLPAQPDSPAYMPDDAVLSRRDFIEAAGGIRDKWNQPLFRKGCRIPMGVTVTRIEPDRLNVGNVRVKNQRFYIPFELRVGTDRRIDYFFDPADYPALADPAMILMPWSKGEPAFFINDRQIEAIAFTTSAYPMAFGRKRLQYCRLQTSAGADEGGQPVPFVPAEKDLFCPESYELTEALFSDGGLFDNLPIGIARVLAERKRSALDDSHPVTYLYLDPKRVRYEPHRAEEHLACESSKPPPACRTLTYNLLSESKMLYNAMGTARTYELYRELSSDNWQLNLAEISYRLGRMLQQRGIVLDCEKMLPYFSTPLDCPQHLTRAGQLLELAYDNAWLAIDEPYSVKALQQTGNITRCRQRTAPSEAAGRECRFDTMHYRRQLADALLQIVEQAGLTGNRIYSDIKKSRLNSLNDRTLRVSSRGAPITGTLLGSFGSFLDYKFREYDYYVGVYDAIVLAAGNLCGLHYDRGYQADDYRRCFDEAAGVFYDIAGLKDDPRGRFVFAVLARDEFAATGQLPFAYAQPVPDSADMRMIHAALKKSWMAGEDAGVFFEQLKAEAFVPTPGPDGRPSMLAQILEDTDTWASEITRRVTSRLVYLETQAEKVFARREPDPEKREHALTELMGASAFILRRATYRNPPATFSPSTAPEEWWWRNLIPYEGGFDMVAGDIYFSWQPTMALTQKDLLSARATLGFAGGLFESSKDVRRENFLSLGPEYSRKTSSYIVSAYGVSAFWQHNLVKPKLGGQDTAGVEVHIKLLKDGLRLGLGVRDVNHGSETAFFTLGVLDVPGIVYWLTR